jgi:hypothetical protein
VGVVPNQAANHQTFSIELLTMSIQDDELVDVAKDSMMTSHPKLMALHRRLLDGSLMPLELNFNKRLNYGITNY